MSSRGSSPTRLTQPLSLILASALVLVALNGGGRNQATAAGVGDCNPGAGWGTPRSDLATQVVGLVNQHRAGLGLGGLAQSATLTAAAKWKALHMAFYGYMTHEDPAPPVARSVGNRLAACGYSASGWGENIAQGHTSAASVMQSWLGSPGHRANIERSSFRAIGVGVAAAANGRLSWVQAFGPVADSGSPPPAPTPPAAPPAPTPPPAAPSAPKPPASAPKPPASAPKPPASAPKPPPPAPKPTAPPPAPPNPTRTAATTAAAAPVPATRIARTLERRHSPELETSRLLQWGQRPRAGQRFTGRLAVSMARTHQRLRTGQVTCKARTAGRPVWVGAHRFRNGFVVCTWRIPQVAEGHRLIGTIRVVAGGRKTARWFSRIVR